MIEGGGAVKSSLSQLLKAECYYNFTKLSVNLCNLGGGVGERGRERGPALI